MIVLESLGDYIWPSASDARYIWVRCGFSADQAMVRDSALDSVVSESEGTGLFYVSGPFYVQGYSADGPR